MGETPKTSKRKMTEDSPSTYDCVNEMDAPDVTYDYLPKSKVKDNKCNIPLGRRPLKFIRSPPSLSHNTSRLSKQIISPTEDPSEEKKKCEQLFLDIFARKDKNNTSEISDHVTEEIREDDKSKEMNSNDFNETALFDDSSNDVMYQLSQQIEKDIETVSTDNIPPRTVKERNVKVSRLNSDESSDNNSIIRDVPHLQKNKHLKKSLVCIETPKRRHNVHHGANKKRTVHQPSNPSHVQESSVTLLLEDGNDAGFVELDETILTGSVSAGSNISSTQKCTAQEIEDKRLQALKKLQEKKFKSRYYGFRQKISFK